ncbi:MAG: TonB-dependent receptor [Pseudomonadota bacterium]
MNQFNKTAIALAVAQIAFISGNAALAQTAPAPAEKAIDGTAVVVVTGQRAALQSAQKIKQNSDEIVDSIVADDIGKLPDRSVTEVLQRIVGVTMDRTMSKADPEHFSVEGSGVSIRGLTWVRSELNGRDSYSANGGRSLNFEDVPPELMAGVDVYKNPSAEQVEGAIGGLVNLRTAMPFDNKGFKGAISVDTLHSPMKGGSSPSASLLLSNRWKTGLGEFGALVDIAYSESASRTDAFQVEPYYPRTDIVNGKTVWVPKGAQWRTLEFDRTREGAYGALQWKRDDLSSSITFFKSKYQMQWDERAIFSQASPYSISVGAGATYDEMGNLLTGTMSDPANGGINFGADTRTANRKSETTDIAWNVRWKATPSLTFTSDLQRIKAKTNSFDSTVATGIQMPKQVVDLRGRPTLTFDAADKAHLANPANYYWAFTMEHKDASEVEGLAWKGDVKYDFDHKVLRDIRFGARLTERDSTNVNTVPGYNWSPITQTWQRGWDIKDLAYLNDPRFSGNNYLHTFDKFYNGKVAVPQLVFPTLNTATGYPSSYAALHKYHDILCAEQAAAQGWSSGCATWNPASFGTDPAGTNVQSEKTGAFYTQLRFGFDELPFPIDGNIGLRYVKTDMQANGYTVFTPKQAVVPPGAVVVGAPIPNIPAFAKEQDYKQSYNNVLPSLNLRMKASDKLQFRFGFASAMSRPDFSQLQGYTTLEQDADTTTSADNKTVTVRSVTLKGTASGNPYLKPITSKQVDLTAEWYFSPVGSVTVAVFNKQLKDIIINQTYSYALPDVGGAMHNFVVTGPVNGANGKARGIELAYQTYFDKLPGWMSGFGVQGNFTFVDSETRLHSPVYAKYCSGAGGAANLNLNLNGCDTNGQTFGNLPLAGLSRRAFNLALMYDKGPFSARLAYNWRSKSLQAVNANGTNGGDGTDTNPASPTFGAKNVAWGLPTWTDDFGQLDASIGYKISPNVDVMLDAQNITNSEYRQLMDQNSGTRGRAWFVYGARYSAKLRYTF